MDVLTQPIELANEWEGVDILQYITRPLPISLFMDYTHVSML